jgi:hypothetical protein
MRILCLCPRQESNLDYLVRSEEFYPIELRERFTIYTITAPFGAVMFVRFREAVPNALDQTQSSFRLRRR